MMNQTVKFGTDGIRGHADSYPFHNQALIFLGQALYQWLYKKNGHKSTHTILMVTDTRISGDRIKASLATGLLKHAVSIIDAGVLPTPVACWLMQHDATYDVGIVISASHNPYYDNGIKLFGPGGAKIAPEDEQFIADAFAGQQPDTQVFPAVGKLEKKDLSNIYIHYVKHYFDHTFLQGLRIVIDCAHGVTSSIAPALFTFFGAEVITLSAEPNGTNINHNCGALHPEALQEKIVECGADAGFAFDGDGDRIIAVNRYGQVRDGDDILWLLLADKHYQQLNTIVGTVMSNSGFEQALMTQGKHLARVAVGDKYVFKKLDEAKLLLGGEPSGHIILKDYLPVCDGIFVALRLLSVLLVQKNLEMNTFKHFPQKIRNVAILEKKDLTSEGCARIIAQYEQHLDGGRILVRYSGTENILRVMAEALTEQQAEDVVVKLAHDLKVYLG